MLWTATVSLKNWSCIITYGVCRLLWWCWYGQGYIFIHLWVVSWTTKLL